MSWLRVSVNQQDPARLFTNVHVFGHMTMQVMAMNNPLYFMLSFQLHFEQPCENQRSNDCCI